MSRQVEWSRLSPRGREIVVQVGLRITAGLSYEEIATEMEANRPTLRLEHLELPRTPISKGWVSARFRELRRELEEIAE